MCVDAVDRQINKKTETDRYRAKQMESLEYHIARKWKLIPGVSFHLWIWQKVKQQNRGPVSGKHKASAHWFPSSFRRRWLVLFVVVVVIVVVLILLLVEGAGGLAPRFGAVRGSSAAVTTERNEATCINIGYIHITHSDQWLKLV